MIQCYYLVAQSVFICLLFYSFREKGLLQDSTNFQKIRFYQKDQMLHLHSSQKLQDLFSLMSW